ncbi:MAG: DNA-directed RNA polymerase subunit omega [Lachnospirales bacterium]
MLKPSYSELMKTINEEREIEDMISSRFIIVIAVAKRAREIVAGSTPLVKSSVEKQVSIAVDELNTKKIGIRTNNISRDLTFIIEE